MIHGLSEHLEVNDRVLIAFLQAVQDGYLYVGCAGEQDGNLGAM